MKEERIYLRVTPEEKEKIKQLAVIAHGLGLTEKPTEGAVIQLGLNVVWDEVSSIYRQFRDQRGGE